MNNTMGCIRVSKTPFINNTKTRIRIIIRTMIKTVIKSIMGTMIGIIIRVIIKIIIRILIRAKIDIQPAINILNKHLCKIIKEDNKKK